MKKLFRLLRVFVFIFSLCLFLPNLKANPELPFSNPNATISMDFQDISLRDILKIFSMQTGLNFIATEGVQDRRINLYLDNVRIKEAMDKLFKANNLTYELDKGADIFIVKDWGSPGVETITKEFSLKYSRLGTSNIKKEIESNLGGAAGDIVTSIREVLSENGKIAEDTRTNSLVVTDMPSRFARIEEVISRLDIPTPQVMLEVEMLDVSKNAVDKIGFHFGQTPFTAILTGASWGTMWPIKSTKLGLTAIRQFTPGSLAINNSSNTYTAYLDFLRTLSDTKYLARPRILTLNNETAEIKITTQEMVGTFTTTQGQGTASLTTTSAERVETGVSLRVTPQINVETGDITMFIVPVVKDTATSTLNSNYKDPEERLTKSTVRLKDGQTVIIGGLIRKDSSRTVTKLPFFGDIPILGALFRHTNKDKDRERELLVFITPRIIKDTVELAQAKHPILSEREQNTLFGVQRRKAIGATFDNLDDKKRKKK